MRDSERVVSFLEVERRVVAVLERKKITGEMSDHRIEYSSILATEYSGIIFHRQLHIPSLEVNLLSIDGAYGVHARVEFHHPRLSLLLFVDFSTLSDKAEVKRVDIDFNAVLCIRKV